MLMNPGVHEAVRHSHADGHILHRMCNIILAQQSTDQNAE